MKVTVCELLGPLLFVVWRMQAVCYSNVIQLVTVSCSSCVSCTEAFQSKSSYSNSCCTVVLQPFSHGLVIDSCSTVVPHHLIYESVLFNCFDISTIT